MTNTMNAIRKGLTVFAILGVAAAFGLTACGGGGNGGGGGGGGRVMIDPVGGGGAPTVVLNIADGCNDGVSLRYRAFSATSPTARPDRVWPSSSETYVAQVVEQAYTHRLSCTPGRNICFGAEGSDGQGRWGVGIDGDRSCNDCCVTCPQSGDRTLAGRLICGSGGGQGGGSGGNSDPVARGSIPDQTLEVGESVTIDLSRYFTDPDRDRLTYQLTFSQGQSGNVRASVSGNSLRIQGVASPGAIVRVTASDPRGHSAYQDIRVAVGGRNSDPVARGSIPDQTLEVGESVTIDLSRYFTDPDRDRLTYQLTFSQGQSGNVRASVSGNSLRIQGVASPGAIVRVTASDPSGRSAYQDIDVTVARAQRFVAIAWGQNPRTLVYSWASGSGDSASAAVRDASNRCAAHVSASCSVVSRGTTYCVSLAQSECSGRCTRPAVGWASGRTRTQSQNDAVAACRRSSSGSTCSVIPGRSGSSTACGSDAQ